ncbi:MAG: AbrB/MazE/SpoVT family DNA-binding domain-containing protein, partial [Nanoarchaeota archaeon]|nr:AbrB/MazE/SpoVT family DNA-binding domain-containing protein [Nanoarchaeota archaeon]
MKRKVIQMAGKTMLVSLPAPWVKKFGIKKGDELELEEGNQNIIISTKKDYSASKIKIDISDLDTQVIKWTLSAIHKSGYDEVEIIYSS